MTCLTKEDFYEVEEIKGRRIVAGKREYLVKWKGFRETENTWEPLTNLDACSKMIKKYDQDHPLGEEKASSTGRSPRPDKKKGKGKEEPVTEPIKSTPDKKRIENEIEEEKLGLRYEVTKRTKIDEEIVFKVVEISTKKEQFITRRDLLKEDPVALCLFYEKHIVS